MATLRLTAAQAVIRFLVAQRTLLDGQEVSLFAGCWAIFGHGNVAGMGEALFHARDRLPTLRAHNEQAMALAAVAFAKARNRRQMMACTSSIGPGAMNMLTAAGVAHVNRLPVLLLPGDVFASRRPDPVLQQVEDWGDGTVSANDCFRPVSRYWDRITRPEQLLAALPRAVAVLTDPAECGPVTLSLCQDVQAQAFDFPESLFAEQLQIPRRPAADADELARAADLLRHASRPLIVAGGGVLYSEATGVLQEFASRHGIPVAETQAGKGALAWDHPLAVGAIGVTGSSAANALVQEADVLLAVGTRLQDFTTGSRRLLPGGKRLIQLNLQAFDAGKHGATPLVGDARRTLQDLTAALDAYASPKPWRERATALIAEWNVAVDAATMATDTDRPSDAQVVGAVNRAAQPGDTVVCAAGGLPGELHKLWRTAAPGQYHVEYGFSCMGYEIAGGLGVKIARPHGEVFVMVGDGSYLMMNSELQSSVMLGHKLIVVLLDNAGFGCIDRLQRACGGESFNNLIQHVDGRVGESWVDFAGHARSLGALAETVTGIAELEAALQRARQASRTTVIVIATDPLVTTEAGGAWWDVAVPETSERPQVRDAYAHYAASLSAQGTAGMSIRLGTNPIAWSNDDMPELGGDTPLETCLAEARAAGFVGIEKGNKFPADPAALQAVLGRHGLQFVSGWYGAELRFRDVEQEIAAMRPHLDLLRACGCQVMVFAETSGTVQGERTVAVADRPVMREDEWPVFLDRLGRLGDWMQGQGVRIAFHHHMGTVIESAAEIDRMLAGTPDSVGLLLDTGHLAFAGEDPAVTAQRWAHRVNHVHAKDVRPAVMARARRERWSFLRSVVEGVYTVPGDGCVDFAAALAPLRAADYQGWMIVEAEQDPAQAHPLSYATAGYRHLRAVAEAAGFTIAG